MRGSDLYSTPESSVGEAIWIGPSDRAAEGVWVWADGYAGGFDNWGPGDPNDSGGARTAAYWTPTLTPVMVCGMTPTAGKLE